MELTPDQHRRTAMWYHHVILSAQISVLRYSRMSLDRAVKSKDVLLQTRLVGISNREVHFKGH